MSDLISKRELYHKISETYKKGRLSWGANEIFKDIIGECDSIENKAEWIPVFERLPEVGENGLSEWVLVTIKGIDKTVTMYDRICHGEWLTPCFDGEEVLAWQPLPEPYKAERG